MSSSASGARDFGLPLSALRQLLAVIANRAAVEQVLLYESRAMGNFRPGSDIDLCLVAPQMTLPDLFRPGMAIDDLLLPWKVDLCLWHQLDNPSLREHIERVGVVLA